MLCSMFLYKCTCLVLLVTYANKKLCSYKIAIYFKTKEVRKVISFDIFVKLFMSQNITKFSHMFLSSICCNMLFSLKYMKKVWPQTDVQLKNRESHGTTEKLTGPGIIRPHFDNWSSFTIFYILSNNDFPIISLVFKNLCIFRAPGALSQLSV